MTEYGAQNVARYYHHETLKGIHKDYDVHNREQRRLVILDVGKDIREASVRVALIQGVIGFISGMLKS